MEIEHQSLVVKIRFNKQPMPANQNSVKKVSHYQFDTLNVLKSVFRKVRAVIGAPYQLYKDYLRMSKTNRRTVRE